MKNKAKILVIFTVFCLVASLTLSVVLSKVHFERTVSIMSSFSNGIGRMKGSYRYFSGEKSREINLKKGEKVTINYESVVKEGSLEISILDGNDNTIKELPVNTSGKETIKASKDMKYKIFIKGTKTRGSFNVSWKR